MNVVILWIIGWMILAGVFILYDKIPARLRTALFSVGIICMIPIVLSAIMWMIIIVQLLW